MLSALSSHERVERVMRGERPDRLPLDNPAIFPGFRERWAGYMGLRPDTLESHYGLDVWEVAADHSPWPSRARIISDSGDERLRADGFGQVCREKRSSPGVYEVIETALENKSDLDGLEFEPASDDRRYAGMAAEYALHKDRYWVRGKVGGPYSRSKFLRGETRFLMDLVEDEPFARALVGRVTDHMIAVGVESIRRLKLKTAMHVHDDFASLRAMLFSPRLYERIFLPAMARMCEVFHAEGVRVVYGGEGRTIDVLPMLAGAGVDAFCCIEPRAGMDPTGLRRLLGDRAVFFGTICNTVVLAKGSREEIRAAVLREVRLARGGRALVGPSHSVSDDVPPENLDYMWRLIREWAPMEAELPEA